MRLSLDTADPGAVRRLPAGCLDKTTTKLADVVRTFHRTPAVGNPWNSPPRPPP